MAKKGYKSKTKEKRKQKKTTREMWFMCVWVSREWQAYRWYKSH